MFRLQPFQKIATSLGHYEGAGSPPPPGGGGAGGGAAAGDGGDSAPHIDRGERGVWYATEKLHGAQLQVYCGRVGGRLVWRAAKRSGWLDPLEGFFGFQEVVEELEPALLRAVELFCEARRERQDFAYAVLYGELFGGWYPDEPAAWRGARDSGRANGRGLVAQGPGAGGSIPVQEGVYYSGSRHFAVFDIAVVNATHEAAFVPFSQTLRVARSAGLLSVPVVASGAYESVNGCSEAFDSVMACELAKACGSEPLPPSTNLAEGLVIRPDCPHASCRYRNAPARPLVKRKQGMFREVEAIENAAGRHEAPATMVSRAFKAFVTLARAVSVVSKVGPGAPPELLAELMAADVLEDFWSSAPQEYIGAASALSQEDAEAAEEVLHGAIARLLGGTGSTLAPAWLQQSRV